MDMQNKLPGIGDGDFWTQGLNRSFFKTVYLRAIQVGVPATLIAVGFEQLGVALGFVSGLVVGLFSLWTVELTVRLLFQTGDFAGVKLAIAALVKMPLLIVGLLGVAWAGYNGHMNIFAVVGGVLIVHGAMLVMAVGTAMANESSCKERYR
jgi:hypothetical protein